MGSHLVLIDSRGWCVGHPVLVSLLQSFGLILALEVTICNPINLVCVFFRLVLNAMGIFDHGDSWALPRVILIESCIFVLLISSGRVRKLASLLTMVHAFATTRRTKLISL